MKSPLRFLFTALFLVSVQLAVFGQTPTAKLDLMNEDWAGFWIHVPGAAPDGLAVYHFRKSFSLENVPAHFVVHVSGDRRYRFYVNGVSVGVGPQRSDPYKWRYETYDLTSLLKTGSNVLSAVVWNYSEEAPYALFSVKTGFLVQGDSAAEAVANTDKSWRAFSDRSYTAVPLDRAALKTFLVTGSGHRIDGASYPWRWTQVGFDDSVWSAAEQDEHGTPDGVGTDVTRWLAPRNLPPMDEKIQRLARVRRAEGISASAQFLEGKAPLTIPAHSDVTLLLDQNAETNAFPHLITSGGRGATVRLTYAEALVDAKGNKGNRDEIDGRHILGVDDEFVSDGGDSREFTTLLFRTFRYLQAKIHTEDQPLIINDLYGVATGYPFEEKGSFHSDDPSLTKIWNVGWRTARLCAYETYTDCPYYEQLQYIGDTRIQALITLYVSGDDRLMRNAIELFDRSRRPMGLTLSRYPATTPQIIPTFSLFWVQMVHDYWMHRQDDAFVSERLLGIQNVLTWFEQHMDDKTGMLGPLPYWCFVDWPDQWPWVNSAHPGGQPAGAREGGSAIVSLQLAWTLDDAAQLFNAYGRKAEAAHYSALADTLRKSVVATCWDAKRNLIADTPAKTTFSQHANTLAVLSHAIEGDRAKDLMQRVADDQTITSATIYFRFYLLKALKVTGLGDQYLDRLQPWHEMIARGLSTFAEKPDPTRSDCHAWSASPNYDLLATVCGVEPDAPGFTSVKIEPHLGKLKEVEGTVPHPDGLIRVSIHRDGAKSYADISLPGKLTGKFIWEGRTLPLQAGDQHLALSQ